MNNKNARQWIDELELERHPEGGWFRRVYTSEQTVDGIRPVMSSIHYLLEADDFSAFHRLKLDEQWHFYSGHSLSLHLINPAGEYSTIPLSSAGPFQATVPAGHLFGATVEEGFALVGCTVAPGFSFSDFELPSRQELLRVFPEHADLIHHLSR